MTEMMNKELSRKTFLKGGGVMIVGFSAFAQAASAANGTTPFSQRGPGDFLPLQTQIDSWLAITTDNKVIVTHGETELGHGYFPPFAITAAAFWIAVRIRGYVPQRQRWPFMAVRICASVGRLVVASRSAAWIIIPFWQ
jgi:hypothetical protein